MNKEWLEKFDIVDFAFQPIINPFTGITYALESLIRNTDKLGYKCISNFFDDAYNQNILFQLDVALREKAVKKFTSLNFNNKVKLFYNYDPRILEMKDYINGFTENILQKYGLNCNNVCFEINEKYQISNIANLKSFITSLKDRNIKIAIDDFGSGFAGLELFYHSEPDYLKFDRFLISGINNDVKKRSFCSHIISLCKLYGIIVIAEGIETEQELYTCKDLGFDLLQGFFIQKPQMELNEISLVNEKIKSLISKRTKISKNEEIINKEIIILDTIGVDDNIKVIFEKFHDKLNYNFFPVIDSNGYPMGILHEKNIKKYVYSPYGKELLYNKSFNNSIQRFISYCPIADINVSEETILEIFVNNPQSEGGLITKELRYIGFLNAKSLLNIINQKNLCYAREANPLTKLPGNILINNFLNNIFEESEHNFYLIYFDFDNFKPFNDKFGFRQGDRAILFFADLLRKNINEKDDFIGHIGGDDFFVGIKSKDYIKDNVILIVKKIVEEFSSGMISFYDRHDIENGFYISKDRNGEIKSFDFLSVSAGVIEISRYERDFNLDIISEILTTLKKEAKIGKDKMSFYNIGICEKVLEKSF